MAIPLPDLCPFHCAATVIYGARHKVALTDFCEGMHHPLGESRRCLSQRDLQRGLDLTSSLTYYWITRGTTEGVQWLDAFLAPADGTPAAHALAYFVRGFLGVLQSDPDAARPALERAVEQARATGPVSLVSRSLALASLAASMAGDLPSARRLLDQAEAATTGIEHDVSAMMMLFQARALG